MCFGPKSFLVVSDPVITRHLLRENNRCGLGEGEGASARRGEYALPGLPALPCSAPARGGRLRSATPSPASPCPAIWFGSHAPRDTLAAALRAYDKGALAVVLEDIMGKGLIPADPVTWASRRRAIAPAFHKLYLERMVRRRARPRQHSEARLSPSPRDGWSCALLCGGRRRRVPPPFPPGGPWPLRLHVPGQWRSLLDCGLTATDCPHAHTAAAPACGWLAGVRVRRLRQPPRR